MVATEVSYQHKDEMIIVINFWMWFCSLNKKSVDGMVEQIMCVT